MKKTLFVVFVSIFACMAWAETVDTLHIANPGTWSASELRNYVGRTVVFDCPIYVCNNNSNPITVSTRRFYAPTNQAYPKTPENNNIATLNNSAALRLSGVSGYHRNGERIHGLKAHINSTSSIAWEDGTWMGNSRADLEKGIPYEDLGDYSLLVCCMNLEYYLTVPNTEPGSTMGPSSTTEHKKQRTKISKALAKIAADVFGFIEIESGDDALREIAEDLEKNTGHPYAYISDGTSRNGTYTKAGYVYRSDKVAPYGALQHNNAKVQNRKKIQCFRELDTDEKFLFSVNHFKAKSGNGSGLDANQGDGQGSFNNSRVLEAESVISQYKRFFPQIKEKDILVMGDLNAYGKEDPITKFTQSGFTDLHRYFHADSSYSYVFGGLAGYLDHAIVNPTMLPQVTGMVAYHISSDELDAYTYDKSNDQTMFRCSDHDPVLVGLRLDKSLSYEPVPSINCRSLVEDEELDLTITNAYNENLHSYYTIHTASGWLVTEGEILGDEYVVARPKDSGIYIIRLYTGGQVYQKKIIIP